MLSLRGVRGIALLASITLGAVRSVPAATPVRFAPLAPVPGDTAPEPVVIDLRIGRITGTTVQAYRVRSEVLLPLSQFFQLAEIRHRLTPDGRLEATVDPGNRRIVIDIRSDTMQYGDHRVRIEREFIRFESSELYVGSERLGDLLGVMFSVDWSELTATVVDPSSLPIARRLQREAAREAYLRRPDGMRPDVTLGLERPSWDGVVVDYSLFSPSNDPVAGSTYGVGLGADVGGGSLEMLAQSVGPAEAGRVHVDASWNGVWRDNRWVKQLRLGDVPSTGPRVRALRGFSITNAPFVRPSLLGSLRYAGTLQPGWSVEAYRAGDLVAYDSTDATGGFAIDLPVRYGENPVDFVAYGPFGEIREFNRTYRVLAELLPANRFEYGLAAGQCPAPTFTCRTTANVDLRYGATRRWTIQGGFDQFWRDSLSDRLHPYASVVGNPSNSWAVQSEIVGSGVVSGALRYEPSVDLRIEGDYAHFARDTAPVLFVPGRRDQWSLTGFLRPRSATGFFFFNGRLEQIRSAAGALTRARLDASVQTDEVRFLPYLRMEHGSAGTGATDRQFAGLSTFVVPRPRWGTFLSQTLVRTTTELERRSGLVSWAAFAARPIAHGMRLEVGANWQRGNRGLTYSLTLTSYFQAVRAVTSFLAPPGQPVTGGQFLQGSVLWDRRTDRLGVAPGPSVERSGLSGHVFLDENANGIRDPGEPPVMNARVLIGSLSARSDSNGSYHVWDLVPFEPVIVSLDSLSLESPLLVPLFARTSIVPGPNRFRSLDIPVVESGIIEGRVLRNGAGVAAVTLFLTDRRSGARRTLVTFNDGAFYLMGVRPGDYDLTVSEQVLDALAVDAEPLRFSLAPTPNGIGRSDLELKLKPRF
ncbi:MAG TPA: carboxypeptidase-like regulatory domain-containing protein [Gemmatimonadales bacterium]|nr:carboxypeptidase-like regulatory domain-containing protein [Gemmatimonadales bacterium]